MAARRSWIFLGLLLLGLIAAPGCRLVICGQPVAALFRETPEDSPARTPESVLSITGKDEPRSPETPPAPGGDGDRT